MPTEAYILRSIRLWLAIFIVGLILSGVTAFPLQHELALLDYLSNHLNLTQHLPALAAWINARYPFLAYGTDWLAFGHIVIATAFVLPWRDPTRYEGIITWGLVACAGVLPLAFIAGPLRDIPIYWRIIDSSFGVVGCLPLLLVRRRIRQYAFMTKMSQNLSSPPTPPNRKHPYKHWRK